MNEADERASHVSWDRSQQRESSCALATARAREDHVVIDFGELLRAAEDPELIARLTRRIAMRPVAAKRLCDMLMQLTAEGGVSAEGKS